MVARSWREGGGGELQISGHKVSAKQDEKTLRGLLYNSLPIVALRDINLSPKVIITSLMIIIAKVIHKISRLEKTTEVDSFYISDYRPWLQIISSEAFKTQECSGPSPPYIPHKRFSLGCGWALVLFRLPRQL